MREGLFVMKRIATDKAPQAIGPYSQAVQAGNLLFVSGQIPLTPAGQLVEGGIEEQVHQVFRNVQAILEAAGASWEQVVKVGLFLTDLSHFATVNAIYEQYLGHVKPARFTVEVSALPKGALVEMEAIAYLS
ncbi:MAG: deaminase [Bacillus thermozeamaize]|jgi:2-iminobutanoate/2-iminopropanoate deaminase|uniref:Deaminase n=1 Tax=Bacillus thermozeamaize TaxID=230954 RepID=A0A1Y3PGS3_9BACI|nr:MAG: deaminase [Bacillus thermozeamaize]